MSVPKVYLIDIETCPNLGWMWGKWEQNALRYEQEWGLLCFAYRALDGGEVLCPSRSDYQELWDVKREPDSVQSDVTRRAEAPLVRAAWSLLDSADVLIGHNIDRFDNRRLRAKFLEHRLPPPRPYKTIDTLKIARAQFAFNSNKLDDLAQTLGLGRKVSTGGIDLWFGCMAGDPAAWDKMVTYCKHDVVLLGDVYHLVRAWAPNHPDLAMHTGRPGCPTCMSPRVHRRGIFHLKTRTVAQWQCQACHHWFRMRLNAEVK